MSLMRVFVGERERERKRCIGQIGKGEKNLLASFQVDHFRTGMARDFPIKISGDDGAFLNATLTAA